MLPLLFTLGALAAEPSACDDARSAERWVAAFADGDLAALRELTAETALVTPLSGADPRRMRTAGARFAREMEDERREASWLVDPGYAPPARALLAGADGLCHATFVDGGESLFMADLGLDERGRVATISLGVSRGGK